jgi:EAL domain-containing protein (putative c-di-GMP-specific phosphodiesterase class I)
LNPAELVEAAESSGLMNQLGSQVLQATCEQLSLWDAQLRSRAPDHISVNVSPRQLVDPGLATQVVAALGFSAIEPRRLWLEITESTLVGQHEVFVERISFLRDLGVRVGLDEFGAGYSTLNSLKRFPLDFVKIDRTMVAGLGNDQRDTAIVRATIELAHSLGLAVVAVGVETDEQCDLLTTLGCDHAQGYLFSPAVTPEELLSRLDQR